MGGDRRLALVTGASRGIGAAVARCLADSYELLLGGRDHRALTELACTLPRAASWPVELTDFDAVAKATRTIQRLDLLVHSAGVWEPGRIGETSPETWRHVFDVNVFAVAELTRLLLPALRVAGGRVVLINSTAGRRASPARGAYAASKYALRAFGEVLQAEESENGVGVASIYPGRVSTDMQRRVRRDEGGTFDEGQYLAPESVARAVLAAAEAPTDSQFSEIVVSRAVRSR